MSHAQPSPTSPRNSTVLRLPTWAGPALVSLALLVGLGLSLALSSINWVYACLFAVAAFAATIAVNLRGLFLTVMSIPAVYGLFTFLTGWLFTSQSSHSSAMSKTSLITAIYPIVEHFPSLIIVFLGCAFVAVLRLWLASRTAKTTRERETASRRITTEAERRNREAASRARTRSGRLTVAELAARNAASRPRHGAEESARPIQPVRSNQSAQPAKSARTGRFDQPVQLTRPARAGRSDQPAQPTRPARPMRPEDTTRRARIGERDREARRREQQAERANNTTSVREQAHIQRPKPDPNLRAGAPITPAEPRRPRRHRLNEDLYGES